MSGPDDRSPRSGGGHGTGRLLRYGALGLVVAAAAVLAVGSDDARFLRLGILAALWAALVGAFAAARMRREVTIGTDRAEDLRTIYQLELEREVAARREHELAVERELRRQVEQESRDELDALRTELRSLRENLQQLLGGELLVERVALRAESTRVRSLPESSGTPKRALNVPPASVHARTANGSAASAESPAAVSDRGRRSEPAAAEGHPVSPPLPRRDPAVRTGSTLRGPRPETSPPARRTASFIEDPLFGEVPQHSSLPWTPSWQQRSAVRDEPRPAERADRGSDLIAADGRHHGPASRRLERNGAEYGAARGNGDSVGGHRRAPDVLAGARSGRRSVDELLAAYGGDPGPRRHRRRDDD